MDAPDAALCHHTCSWCRAPWHHLPPPGYACEYKRHDLCEDCHTHWRAIRDSPHKGVDMFQVHYFGPIDSAAPGYWYVTMGGQHWGPQFPTKQEAERYARQWAR